MKKHSGFLLLAFFLSQTTSTALAVDQDAIIFGRGVFRSQEEAYEDDVPALRRGLRNQLGITDDELDRRFIFRLATNTTRCSSRFSCLGDLFESAVQWAALNEPTEDERGIWSLIWSLTPPASLADEFVRVVASFQPLDITAADVTEQLELYNELIGDSHMRVVLVAHSQGNYFGNLAYKELTPEHRASFGMYSVATPAADVLGRTEPYYTEFLDFIHLVPDSLPSNHNTGECTIPWICHAFAASYMNGLSGGIISAEVLDLLASLPRPQSLPPDKLLALDSFFDRLLIMDPVTGESRTLMILSHDFLSGLAADRRSGLLYSVDLGTNELVEINPRTGSERAVGIVGIPNIQDLTFGPDGALYGVATGVFSTSQLVRIDTQTGLGSRVGGIANAQFSGLVYDPDSGVTYATLSFANGLFEVSTSTGIFTLFNLGLGAGFVQMADIPQDTKLFVVGNSSPANASAIGRIDPAAPVFTLLTRFSPVRSITGIEMISSQGVVVPANQPAVIGLLAPTNPPVLADRSATILWLDDDVDSAATISLWYSPDPSCSNPIRIVDGLPEDDEFDQYNWNTTLVPVGQYHVLAVISDGVNKPVADCSRWSVLVSH